MAAVVVFVLVLVFAVVDDWKDDRDEDGNDNDKDDVPLSSDEVIFVVQLPPRRMSRVVSSLSGSSSINDRK